MGKTKTAFIGETLPEEKPKKKKEDKKPEVTRAPGQKGGERVKMVGADEPTPSTETSESKPNGEVTQTKGPRLRGKNYKQSLAKIDKSKLYSVSEAIKLVKEADFAKFDSSVELHLVVKKEGLNTQLELPHSSGQSKKVEIASDKTVKKLEDGKVDFDILLATADMMPKLVPFARILGPKGLMPNPKNGTLIKSEKDADKFSGNTINIKTERKAPIIHILIGKKSMSEKDLTENLEAVLKTVNRRQIVKAYLCTSMSPSAKIKID